MNATNLLNELKSKRSSDGEVLTNFDNFTKNYMDILASLEGSEKSKFSLNVLCIICKGLEAEPWRSVIAWDSLGVLVVSCCEKVSQAELASTDRPKYLACVYHFHRYLTQQKASSESILKLSDHILVGKPENMLPEYCKTYWAILMDKLIYIESLNNPELIVNILDKISENVRNVAKVYSLLHFCKDNLVIILKKLYFLYNNLAPQKLNVVIGELFKDLTSHKDIGDDALKTLKDEIVYDMYRKVLECFYVIVQVSTKCNFENCPLPDAVKFVITMFNKRSDIYHVVRTLYFDTFCQIFTKKHCASYRYENVLKECLLGMDKFEKLGYTNAAKETYSILAQNLRLYIEYCVKAMPKKMWIEIFTTNVLMELLNFILFLMKKLPKCTQHVKCENCHIKGGCHDALRISCIARNLVMTSLQFNIRLDNLLPVMYDIVMEQKTIVNILIKDGCRNKDKCRAKIQTDAHNDAIALYKAKYLAYSNQLFDFYIENEIERTNQSSITDLASLTRAFFNKGICELDMGMLRDGLQCAFLGMALSASIKGLDCAKYMNLVIEIKSKAVVEIKDKEVDKILDDEGKELQMESVLDSCLGALKKEKYQGLKDILSKLCFTDMLLLELDAYRTCWPAVVPLSGVCRALNRHSSQVNDGNVWRACGLTALSIATSAKSISCPHFHEMLENSIPHLKTLADNPKASLNDRLLTSACLLIWCDEGWQRGRYRGSSGDSAERILSGRWTEDENCLSALRENEQLTDGKNAAVYARKAFENIKDGDTHTQITVISLWLHIAEMAAHGALLHSSLTLAAQLLHTVAQFSSLIDDALTQLRSVGLLLSWGRRNGALEPLLKQSAAVVTRVTDRNNMEMEDVLMHYFLDAAVYYLHTDREHDGLKLLSVVQRREAQYRRLQTDGDDDSFLLSGRLVTTFPRLRQLVAWWWGAGKKMSAMDKTLTTPVSTLTAHTVALRAQHQYIKSHSVGVSYSSRNLASYRVGWRCCIAASSAARVAGGTGCLRRARAAQATPLRAARATGAAARAAKHLLEAARLDAEGEKIDECRVKLDSVRTILNLHPRKKCADMTGGNVTKCHISNTQCSMDDVEMKECVESMLDLPNSTNENNSPSARLRQVAPNSPILDVARFTMPEFLSHTRACECVSCTGPDYLLLALQLGSVEAFLHLRSGDFELAREYFAGLLKMTDFVSLKVRHLVRNMETHYDKVVLEIVNDYLTDGLLNLEAQILLDASLFRMAVREYEKSETLVKKMLDLLKEMKFPDTYLVNNAYHLSIALKHYREVTAKELRVAKNARYIEQSKIEAEIMRVEQEMDNLKINPVSETEKRSPKTPELKAIVPPKNSKVKIAVNDEQLPHVKRRIIKIDLDEKNTQEVNIGTKNKFFKSKSDDKTVQELPKIEKAVPELITLKKSIRATGSRTLKKPGEISSIPAKSTKKELEISSIPTKSTKKDSEISSIPTRFNKKDSVTTSIPTKLTQKDLGITSVPTKATKKDSNTDSSNGRAAGPLRKTVKSKIPESTSEKSSPISRKQEPVKSKTVAASSLKSLTETNAPQKSEPVPKRTTRTTRTDTRTDASKSSMTSIATKIAAPITKMSSLTTKPTVSAESSIPKRVTTKQFPEISISETQDLAVNFAPQQSVMTYSRKITLLKRATSPGKLNDSITPTKEVKTKLKPVKTTRAAALRLEKIKLSPDTSEMKKTDNKMLLKTRRNK